MSASDDYYTNLLNAAVINIHGYGDLVIYIIGTIGNLLSIAIFLKKKWRKNVCVFYFLVCLLLSIGHLNATVLTAALLMKWKISDIDHSAFLCKLMFYVTYETANLVPTILILASIDRLLISSQNVDTRLYSSRRLAYLLIGISTVFWMLFHIHILIKVDLQQVAPYYFVCYFDFSALYLNFINYGSASFNCLFFLLTIIFSALSFKNVRHIRSIPRQQRREVRSMTKKDFQLLRCLFAQNIAYIVLSSFLNIYSVYRVITREENRTAYQTAVVEFLYNLFMVTYFTFYCSSFFIFVCVSKAFRQEIKLLIYKVVGKDLTAARNEEEQPQQNVNKNDIELVVDVVSERAM